MLTPAMALTNAITRAARGAVIFRALPRAMATVNTARLPQRSVEVVFSCPPKSDDCPKPIIPRHIEVHYVALTGGQRRDLRLLLQDPWHKENRAYLRSKKRRADVYQHSLRDHREAVNAAR